MSSSSEEELQSLDGDPETITNDQVDDDEDNTNNDQNEANSEAEDEELRSLTDSPGRPLDNIVSVSEEAGTSSAAIANTTSNNDALSTERRGGTVRSFRTRIDDDGEVVFEFGFASEEEEEEDDPDYHPRELAGTSTNVYFDIDTSRDVPQQLNSVGVRRIGLRGRHPPRASPFVPSLPLEELPTDSEADEDYASVVSTPVRRNRMTSENSEPTPIIPTASTGARVGRGRPKGRKQKKPKKRKVPAPKVCKPRAPPKPLKPKFVYEVVRLPENGNRNVGFNRPGVVSLGGRPPHKIAVNYSLNDIAQIALDNTCIGSKKTYELEAGYKIGEIFLKDTGKTPWTCSNRKELLDTFPGLVEFTMEVLPYHHSNDTIGVIRLMTHETLSEEESALRPRPTNLGKTFKGKPLIFILKRHYFFDFKLVGVPPFTPDMFRPTGLGSKQHFRMDFVGFDEQAKNLQFDLKLLKSAILGNHKLCDIPYSNGQEISDALNRVFKVDIDKRLKLVCEETTKKEDINWFYRQLKKYHAQEFLPEPTFSIQPDCFVPILRSYQKDAVRWMLFREGVTSNKDLEPQPSTSKEARFDLIEGLLKKMYVPVELNGESDETSELKPTFYNPYTGYVCWSRPDVPSLTSGGILADEMGLGKTVEVLCLIMLNQKPILADVEKQESHSDESNEVQEIEEKGQKRSSAANCRESRKRIRSTVETLRHPRLRKRKLSPCEFGVGSNNFDGNEQPDKLNNTIQVIEHSNVDLCEDDDQYEDIDEKDADLNEQELLNKQKPANRKTQNTSVNSSKVRKTENLTENEIAASSTNLENSKIRIRKPSPNEFSANNNNSQGLQTTRNSTPRKAKQVARGVIAGIVNRETTSSETLARVQDIVELNSNNSAKSNSNKKIARRTSSTTSNNSDPPMTTYQGIKQIYDEVLRGYSETSQAKVTPRFHGTFFEASIRKSACFECFCGGYNDDDQRRVVTCTTCNSSQHAECVGFDESLLERILQEGKSYLCPHCTVLDKPYPAKTTLIITPASISYQWINEIQRHVKNHQLSILFYKGVTTHGYIPPAKLADYDIIITTYAVLSTDLNYVDLPHCSSEEGRRFRNAKRFLTIPSPLPCVLYWRVCLDEAQMVEGIDTKMSLMAMKIQATHRWCITGTPINKGLQDLFGLFAFLGVEPISLDYWWKILVQDPFHRKDSSLLNEIFGQLIWRTSKSDVLDQLGIPPQTEKAHWLRFSPVETHFYKQQYEICSNKILDKIAKLRQAASNNILEARLSTLDRKTLQSLLQPFLELRQACCHPQMVKGQLISLQKGTLTMEELLAQLVKKTSLQCAEEHRLIVASLNGMAGIHILQEEWLVASEKYREVLQSAEKNKEHFHTDSLQILHTLENLADLLDRHHDGVPFTLRDDSLRKQAEELKTKYLQKYATGVKAAKDAAEPLSIATEELTKKFICQKQSWWLTTLVKASSLHKIDDLISRIKDDLIDHTKKNNSVITLANKFNDTNGLQHVLVETITQVETLRQSVLKGLKDLQTKDPSSFVHGAVCCHLRKKSQLYYKDTEESGFRCTLCTDHANFLRYESILFKEEKKTKVFRTGRKWQQQKLMGVMATDLTEEEKNLALLKEEEELIESLEHVNVGLSDELRRGTWGDSDTERILKLVHNFSKLNGLSSKIIDDGKTHMQLFESMKKEFRVLRILWRQIYDQVSAVDELSQATTRLRLRYDNEDPVASSSQSTIKKPKELKSGTSEVAQKIQNIHVLERHELETRSAQMQLEVDKGKHSLSILMGQLLYLDTLKKNGYGKKGTSNSEDCPICQNQLGMQWSVLRCGHSYCSGCVKKMCPNTLHIFLCPLCRHSMKYADVSFVDTREPENNVGEEEEHLNKKEIRGSHSTKVEAILQTLFNLQETHPGEKAIIFSTWVDVLEIIAKALDQNDISNCLLNKPGKHFQTNLHRFKTREDIQVILMPITSGSKGLNIVEASHVLLVEPILNLASELQAIGRVHRIGQIKSTCVHRYYVEKTIEEQLFEILRTHDVSSGDEESLTVARLQSLIRSGQINA